AAVMHRFDDDEPPISFERRANVAEHRLVLRHFVIRVVDQNGIELIDRKMWVVDAADDDIDVLDVLTASTITQLVERGLADVDGNGAAIRRDSACDWNREGAVAGTDVSDQRTRLRRKEPDDVCDAVLALKLGAGLLRRCDRGRDGDQHDAHNACKATLQGLHRAPLFRIYARALTEPTRRRTTAASGDVRPNGTRRSRSADSCGRPGGQRRAMDFL